MVGKYKVKRYKKLSSLDRIPPALESKHLDVNDRFLQTQRTQSRDQRTVRLGHLAFLLQT